MSMSFLERVKAAKEASEALKGKETEAPVEVAIKAEPASYQKITFAERIKQRKLAEEMAKAKEAGTYVEPVASPEVVASASRSLEPAQLVEAFLKQGFSSDEAHEEAKGVLELVKADNDLAQIWLNASLPLNSKQLQAVYFAKKGQSFVLTGAAGTGKTASQAAVVETLDQTGAFKENDFKYIGTAPSIAIVAFTKVAVRNIQKAIRKNPRISKYSIHCMTIHALLEFEPVVVSRRNAETGEMYETRIFEPQRHRGNPLTLTHLIIEEASMVGVDLWRRLYDALTPGVQIIYLGDINQLQPVFSKPILAYALVKLPVIELTRVYRQALDNPIIYNAHQVLKGQTIATSEDHRVAVVTGKNPKKQGQHKMAIALQGTFKKLLAAGAYDPEQDIILLPWNKRDLGVKNFNEIIATMLSGSDTLVYCIQGGRNKWYLAVGDRVLIDKRQGTITSITPNPKYVGQASQDPMFCTRDGTPILVDANSFDFDAVEDSANNIDYSNFSIENVEVDEGLRAATHIVRVEWMDAPGSATDLSTAGDFSDSYFQLGYCLTVHKSQGSEWRKVFMIIHFEQMGFLSRELMYTGLTRAREEFVIFCDPITLEGACKKQEIKGDSLAAKIEYFVGEGLPDLDLVPVTKSEENWVDWTQPFDAEEAEQEAEEANWVEGAF